MDYEELAQDILSKATGRETLVPIVASVGLFVVMGFFSLRALKRLPDFEHKAEMVWGAKWYWAVWLAMCAVVYGTLYYGLTATPYLLTTLITTPVLLSLLCWLSIRYLDHQSTGALFCMNVFSARLRGKKFDLGEWQERQRKLASKQRIIRAIVHALHIVIGVFYLYIVLAVSYPADRWSAEMRRVETLGEHIKVQLHSERIDEFDAVPAIPDFEHFLSTGGVQQAWLSLRDIVHLAPKVPGPPDRDLDYYHIFIKATPGTGQAEAEELLARTQQALIAAGEDHYWRIIISSRDKAVSVRGVWPEGASVGQEGGNWGQSPIPEE